MLRFVILPLRWDLHIHIQPPQLHRRHKTLKFQSLDSFRVGFPFWALMPYHISSVVDLTSWLIVWLRALAERAKWKSPHGILPSPRARTSWRKGWESDSFCTFVPAQENRGLRRPWRTAERKNCWQWKFMAQVPKQYVLRRLGDSDTGKSCNEIIKRPTTTCLKV